MEPDKLLPHEPQAEKLVLGTIMTERNALNEVRDILSPECFYDKLNRAVYEAITAIDARGESPDLVTVANEMRKQSDTVDFYTLSKISECYTNDIYQHAAILHDKEKRRRFIEIGMLMQQRAYSEENDIVDILTEAEESLKGLFQSSKDNIATLNQAIREVNEQMSRNASDDRPLTGTPTGFSKIDGRSGGLQRSDLVVIAADTSSGKSSLAIALTLSAAKYGDGVAFYSMEMKKEQIAARMIAIESGVPAQNIVYISVETPIVFYKKSGDVYEPCIQIDSRGFSDCIAIILPEFDPARPTSTAERGIQVFSAEEKDAPRGALVFYNWFNDALEAKISIRDANGVRKSDQTFTLKLGDHCVSLPAQDKRDICDLELSVGSGSAKRTLYASSMRLRDDQCTFFFAVPKKDAAQDGNARPDFKSFRIPR